MGGLKFTKAPIILPTICTTKKKQQQPKQKKQSSPLLLPRHLDNQNKNKKTSSSSRQFCPTSSRDACDCPNVQLSIFEKHCLASLGGFKPLNPPKSTTAISCYIQMVKLDNKEESMCQTTVWDPERSEHSVWIHSCSRGRLVYNSFKIPTKTHRVCDVIVSGVMWTHTVLNLTELHGYFIKTIIGAKGHLSVSCVDSHKTPPSVPVRLNKKKA